MKKQFKIGKKYLIQFWDHCKGEDQILCEVMIWITGEDDLFVYGTWWKIHHDDQETERLNREMVSIVKSTITKKSLMA